MWWEQPSAGRDYDYQPASNSDIWLAAGLSVQTQAQHSATNELLENTSDWTLLDNIHLSPDGLSAESFFLHTPWACQQNTKVKEMDSLFFFFTLQILINGLLEATALINEVLPRNLIWIHYTMTKKMPHNALVKVKLNWLEVSIERHHPSVFFKASLRSLLSSNIYWTSTFLRCISGWRFRV